MVEDDPEDRQLFRMALERGGLRPEIVECRRAEEALGQLEDGGVFDLLVADHQLPGMQGLELCRHLLETTEPAFAIVLLTGAGSEDVAIQALKAGVHEYIIKGSLGYLELLPIELTEAVQRFVDQRERRRAEEALRVSEARLRQVIDLVPHMIFAKDAEGRFRLANRAMADTLGRPVEEIVGRRLDELHGSQKEVEALLELDRAVLWGDSPQEVAEHALTRATGEKRLLETVTLPFAVSGSSAPAVLGISIDITEARRAEEERLRMEAKLLESQRFDSLSRLAGGVAHDFNNLLMGILGNASLALMELAPDHSLRHLVEPIEESAQRAADLSEKLRAFAGGGVMQLGPIDLAGVAAEVARLHQTTMPNTIELDVDLPDVLPAVEADPSQIRQVISNLIANATEALEQHRGQITLRLRHLFCDTTDLAGATVGATLEPGDHVLLEVADTGRGMSVEMRKRIFDPFYTVDFAGRGLGLAAVLGIVRSHRGAIEVESTPGRGSLFRIYFPASERPALTSSSSARAEPWWHGEGTVLVVDDEEIVRTVACRILERAGFETVAAENGQIALDLFDHHGDAIDAVLLDIKMPVLDGAETLPELRRRRPGLPVVMASGYSEREVADRLSTTEALAVLPKPYRAWQLLAAMKGVLDPSS